MKSPSSCPAVLFVVFNRPQLTKKIFSIIRDAKPERLFIHADGPRIDKDEEGKCSKARLETEKVDWPCVVERRYQSRNLGCGRGVSGAIDWFFEQNSSGIILEDDCLPEVGFFTYCKWALETFEDDKRIWHISGMGISGARDSPPLRLSRFPFIWGWATWRDRWQAYSYEIISDDSKLKSEIASVVPSRHGRRYWLQKFIQVRNKEINTWDYQWMLTLWLNRGFALTSDKTRVSNIGFDVEATHQTQNMMNVYAPVSDSEWCPPENLSIPEFDANLEAKTLRDVFAIDARDWVDRGRTLLEYPILRWWQLGISRRLRSLFGTGN